LIQKTPFNYSKRRRKAVEIRHLPLHLLLTGRNISPEKPFSLGHSPAFFPFKIYMNRCREIPASRNKGDTGGETRASGISEEFKRTVLAVFCQFI
jgi:hypothetical protein